MLNFDYLHLKTGNNTGVVASALISQEFKDILGCIEILSLEKKIKESNKGKETHKIAHLARLCGIKALVFKTSSNTESGA